MLVPKGKVYVKATPVYGNLQATGHGILAAHSIEDDVDATLSKIMLCF